MITNDQIIEAAKECGFVPSELQMQKYFHRFALRMYRQGLIDAAEKCEFHSDAQIAAEAIRHMAEEVGK